MRTWSGYHLFLEARDAMIAQIVVFSRTVNARLMNLWCAIDTLLMGPSQPSPIDPRAISLLDEQGYAGQHIHDSDQSSLGDDRTNNKSQD